MCLTPECAEHQWLCEEHGRLVAEGVPLEELVQKWGTPLYLYSVSALLFNVAKVKRALNDLPVKLFYAVKANSTGAILRLLRSESLGAEVVSQGELWRALRAGFPPSSIIFTGSGKSQEELRFASQQGIHAVVVECAEEINVLRAIPSPVRIALRLNLGITPGTHPGLTTSAVGTKFGLDEKGIEHIVQLIHNSNVKLVGLHTHLGSQISDPSPYILAMEKLQGLAQTFAETGMPLEFLDLGGGFALDFPWPKFAEELRKTVTKDFKIYLEPGRYFVATAGCLLTRVLYVKEVHGHLFVVLDAGMNDLLRPALYGAHHPVLVSPRRNGPIYKAQVVGPLCENTDQFGIYSLPPLRAGDLVVFLNAGAYGFSMSSQYNSRPRPAEVLLHKGQPFLIRAREGLEDLVRGEVIPEWLESDGFPPQ